MSGYTRARLGSLILAMLALWDARAFAASGTLSFIEENDSVFDQSDKHYTHGMQLAYVGAPFQPRPASVSGWVSDHLMLPGAPDATLRDGLFLGQSMFTPEDLLRVVPDPRDRPYAGWLFMGARLYRDSGTVLDRADIAIGMIGPASLASDVQRWWHAIGVGGGRPPQGWHFQLRDEPGLVLNEQRTWRVSLTDGALEAEALPEVNLALGNVYDYAGAGLMLRLGQGLAADWGPQRMGPAQQGSDFQDPRGLGWYVFAGFEGRAVARNLFLDGNSFVASRNVGHEDLVGDFTAGAAVLLPALRADFAYVLRSREFPGQRERDQFASITLSLPL